MIPEECPFSNKQKLKLVLHGRNDVCQGHQEKNDKGEYERVECCNECPYFDKALLNPYNPWQVPVVPYVPANPVPLPWTTTVPNTQPFTITWTDYNTTGDENTGGGSGVGTITTCKKEPYAVTSNFCTQLKSPFSYNSMV